jgi:hypothetical protein
MIVDTIEILLLLYIAWMARRAVVIGMALSDEVKKIGQP